MPPLQDLFETHALVKILDFLTLYKEFEYTRTDIAKETGISRRTLYEVFPKLEKFNLVEVTRSYGKVKFYKLNTKNPISKYLIALADEVAFYEAGKATGITLTTKILPNIQTAKPCTTEPSQVSISYVKVEGLKIEGVPAASEWTESLGRNWVTNIDAYSTQNAFAAAMAELEKNYPKIVKPERLVKK